MSSSMSLEKTLEVALKNNQLISASNQDFKDFNPEHKAQN